GSVNHHMQLNHCSQVQTLEGLHSFSHKPTRTAIALGSDRRISSRIAAETTVDSYSYQSS
uniref:Uncharacterized protein n=1 Tax=Aegilops tauschii subsp. strangulata TaxID=200361 RepID=A0A452XKN5_AEGTS